MRSQGTKTQSNIWKPYLKPYNDQKKSQKTQILKMEFLHISIKMEIKHPKNPKTPTPLAQLKNQSWRLLKENKKYHILFKNNQPELLKKRLQSS